MHKNSANKEVTINDIAKKLQLSTATVSRALQDNSSINKKTRMKVQQAARDLGYRHNVFASSLRKQQSNTIGIILHELQSNFITSVLSGIERCTSEAGYDLIITHSAESYKKEAANALSLFHKRVDGLIASLAIDTIGIEHYKIFHEKGIPVIFFDRVDEQSEHAKVIIDNYKCGYEATRHLIEQGCNSIVIVTGSLQRNVYAQRFQGYKDALANNGISFDEQHLIITGLSENCGIEAAEKILQMQPLPEGVFITNDFSAAVCMQKLKEHGICIPKDIAFVGFNNDTISRIIEPQLTSIDYRGVDMGETAARCLLNHLKGISNIIDTNTIVIRSNLLIRKSSLRKE